MANVETPINLTREAMQAIIDKVKSSGDGGSTANYYTKTQVDNKTGDLANLETTAKNNLVAAINENNSDIKDKANHSNLATVETTTASKAYATGDYLVLAGVLYKVTTGIASGATITPGTNVEAVDVGSELKAASSIVSGHIIEKSDGTDMTGRKNLQFVGATVTDDATHDRTVVTVDMANYYTKTEVNAITGDKTNLTTTAKTNLVAAINEVDGDVGDKSTLTTTAKTSLVAAINEVDGDVGNKTTLTTTDKTNLVAAINEVDGDVGDKSTLTTAAKTNLVAAINELDGCKLDVLSAAPTTPVDGQYILYIGVADTDFPITPGIYQYDNTNTEWVLQVVGDHSFTATFTLDATDWVSHEQDIIVTGLKATDNGSIGLPTSATSAQIQAAAKAKFSFTIADGSVTFTVAEDPIIDIPVVLNVIR